MKVCIIQPAYLIDFGKSDECFEAQLELLKQCDDTMDMIVMPESCDIPCLAGSQENELISTKKFNQRLLDAVSETAPYTR